MGKNISTSRFTPRRVKTQGSGKREEKRVASPEYPDELASKRDSCKGVRAGRNDRGRRRVSGRGDAWCELSPADKRIFEVLAGGNARVCGVYPGRQRRRTGNVCVTWRRTGRNITTRRRRRRRRGRRFTAAAVVRVWCVYGFTSARSALRNEFRFNRCYPPTPPPRPITITNVRAHQQKHHKTIITVFMLCAVREFRKKPTHEARNRKKVCVK